MRGPTTTILLAAALSIGGVMANPAYAAASAVTPERVCGPGFARVAHSKQAVKTPGKRVLGYVYLLYNRRTGYNCVTTFKTSDVGVSTFVMATITVQTRGTRPRVSGENEGRRVKHYLGPVKTYGKGRCVKYMGTIEDGGRGLTDAKSRWKSWGNCG
ncbi:hypothetical protein LDL08_32860 [Nonomuraea glycinis]|uniref:Uncharacterized protein n=1 Tax=Nonomuraea glycinis TaxID=2047744 RepID=A0A918E8Y9_9ACTN|nr:hypothetical protein [Nonomuraea glycinis]MCA2180983.1 hypothetical protein [Nonomuraea glycinis]GGP13149.1 hypothetical protein GCM10012278_63780 [Nonomuraea glycinis]